MDEKAQAEYQKGFNEGYLISEHLPDLAKQLSEIKSSSVRFEGFRDGNYQFILDKARENYPAWLKSDRLSSGDKGKGNSKDLEKDDIDRD